MKLFMLLPHPYITNVVILKAECFNMQKCILFMNKNLFSQHVFDQGCPNIYIQLHSRMILSETLTIYPFYTILFQFPSEPFYRDGSLWFFYAIAKTKSLQLLFFLF